MKLLVDLSVLRNAVVTQPATINKTVMWGDRSVTVPVWGWQRKPELPRDQDWRRRQLQCLPTLARLTREGILKLHSYIELGFEESRGQQGMKNTFGDLFAKVPIHIIPAAVERSHFRQTINFSEHISKEAQIEFCEFLLQLEPSSIRATPAFWDRLTDFEKSNLCMLDRFKAICNGLARSHYADAFHLWTAEVNRMDFFLMVERRFPNALRNNRDLALQCRVATPEELIQELQISDLDPMPHRPGGPYTIFE